MATIKAIEAKSVHQIQSGQVIVDLCSVAKELVENSLDAGASSVEVRFKNYGLDSIEVQDNGAGIAASNYPNIALKHYTSKLSNYDDLSTLSTFGFRGEALSSLSALSTFSVITARAEETPRATRLEFERSGVLKTTSTVAAQKGTTATVEDIFDNLPVRRKELSKNIKREYGKVLGLLHAYACIGTNVKFTVKNAMPKGKSMVVFSTKGNATTRENIANVYGAKTLSALVPLDLELKFKPALMQLNRRNTDISKILVRGHISKPVFGEGRQTPDRQMFFVNGRPCGLPQIAKAINEVYKSFNVSQSPFIFADFQMDTNAYDVNVSPDKRTILIHDATALVESLKERLTDMFENQDQTVPQAQLQTTKLPSFRQLTVQRHDSTQSSRSETSAVSTEVNDPSITAGENNDYSVQDNTSNSLFREHFRIFASTREDVDEQQVQKAEIRHEKDRAKRAEKLARILAEQAERKEEQDEYDDVRDFVNRETEQSSPEEQVHPHVRDFNERMAEHDLLRKRQHLDAQDDQLSEPRIAKVVQGVSKDQPGLVQNAFDRMRPKRVPAEIATITIGDKTVTKIIGTQFPKSPNSTEQKGGAKSSSASRLSQKLRQFEALETQRPDDDQSENLVASDDDAVDVETKESPDSQSKDDPRSRLSSSPETDERQDASNVSAEEDDSQRSEESDADYIDESEKKAIEEARVAELIRAAESSAALPSKENLQRANKAFKGSQNKDSTTSLRIVVDASLDDIQRGTELIRNAKDYLVPESLAMGLDETETEQSQEAHLSLTVAKEDFAKMDIVGQFNLGFILAVRPVSRSSSSDKTRDSAKDELFIIDQHASDEKYNFERLQAETVVGTQRLVRPGILDLTAVEEEVVLENISALEKNGFIIEADTSGTSPVGRRCKLVSLPLSKEVVFGSQDLDELIHLLAESPTLGSESSIPRPSKVRKMFAMRACRSSIMIGKTLSKRQMSTVVAHMGTIDKPWNCPHGRPTMRHLTSLNGLMTWDEGDEAFDNPEQRETSGDVWRRYMAL